MSDKIFNLDVPSNAQSQRLDIWLASELPHLSRAKIQKLIRRSKILVDGKNVKANWILKEGQSIHIEIDKEIPSARITPHPMKLDILYEDEDLLVLNKSAGISVHPGAGTQEPTLIEGVFHWLGRTQTEAGENIRPGIVHRLDKDTTGVMVYAKNEHAQSHLSKQFANKQNQREYIAILDGLLKQDRIEHESYLYRDPVHRKRFASISAKDFKERFGQEPKEGTGYRLAKSLFVKKASYQSRLTLASITLRTGRTHQIRVHSKDLMCPVLGDPIYNTPHEWPKSFSMELRKQISSLKRQMLHARILGFIHPLSGKEMVFEAPLPEDFQNILNLLSPLQDH